VRIREDKKVHGDQGTQRILLLGLEVFGLVQGIGLSKSLEPFKPPLLLPQNVETRSYHPRLQGGLKDVTSSLPCYRGTSPQNSCSPKF
jgi:hypothetical protein